MPDTSIRHPAVYNRKIYPVFSELITKYDIKMVLDPFAGKGGIFKLWDDHPTLRIKALELEQKWADSHWATEVGDALELPRKWTGVFDAVFTSPTFGNRMADHFVDHQPEKHYTRNTYRHSLGEELQPTNSGRMHFGYEYAEFHHLVNLQILRALRPGGILGLEAKDFYQTMRRHGTKVTRRVRVSLWFYHSLLNAGFEYLDCYKIYSSGNRQGANRKRVPYSRLWVFRKPIA